MADCALSSKTASPIFIASGTTMQVPPIRIIATIALVALLFATPTAAQHNPTETFLRATMLDEGNQNLIEAIQLYKQFLALAKADGARAAIALYRLGVLYERLGRRADAERAYRKLVSQYPEQTEFVPRAKARLRAFTRTGPPDFIVYEAGPSPDGLFLASFTFKHAPSGFSQPALDTNARRAYVFTHSLHPLGKDVASKLAAQRGLRQLYLPSTLVVLDLDSLAIVKTLPMPAAIGSAAFNPATNKLYAAAIADGEIRVIDPLTFAQQTIVLEGFPHDVAVNPRTNKIYVSCFGFAGNDRLFVIDGTTNKVIARADLDGVAGMVVVNPDTNRAYASTGDPAKTRVFDGEDNSPLEDLPSLSVAAVDLQSSSLYALAVGQSGSADALVTLDARDHHRTGTLLTGDHLDALLFALGQQSKRVYVGLSNENQIAVIDSTAGVEANRFAVNHPCRLAVDQATGRILLGYTKGGIWSLSVLDPRSLSEEAPEEFLDEFDSDSLNPEWTVVPGRGSYSLVENRGALRYRVAPRSPGGGDDPMMLTRKFRGDHWTLEVKASYSMGTTGAERNLVFGVSFGAWAGDEEKAVVQATRHRGDWNGCCPGATGVILNQKHIGGPEVESPPNANDSYVWRMRRSGRTITVERSDDGINFVTEAENVFGPQINGLIQYVRIFGDSFGNDGAYGDFDYLRLTKTPHSRIPMSPSVGRRPSN